MIKFILNDEKESKNNIVRLWLEKEGNDVFLMTGNKNSDPICLMRFNPDGTFYRYLITSSSGFQADGTNKIKEV